MLERLFFNPRNARITQMRHFEQLMDTAEQFQPLMTTDRYRRTIGSVVDFQVIQMQYFDWTELLKAVSA